MPHEKVHRISHATKRSYDEQICKKKEFLKKKRWEYQFCVNRRQKHEIIAELSQTCDYSNKYAIRLLNAKAFPLKEKPKQRQRRYTQEDLLWLRRIWSESDFLCGKLLATMIPAVLENFEKDGIAVPASVREHLLKISPASIDRMLKTAKQDRPAKRRGNVLNALRKEIPRVSLSRAGAFGRRHGCARRRLRKRRFLLDSNADGRFQRLHADRSGLEQNRRKHGLRAQKVALSTPVFALGNPPGQRLRADKLARFSKRKRNVPALRLPHFENKRKHLSFAPKKQSV